MPDMVNHPSHYVSESGVECIDVIRLLPFTLASAIKYVWRYRDKWNATEDLDKAKFYLQDYEKSLFHNKTSGEARHTLTVLGEKQFFETSIHTFLRKHSAYLEKYEYPEARFFSILYAFLGVAQHGVVRYETFSDLLTELEALRDKVAVEGVGDREKGECL